MRRTMLAAVLVAAPLFALGSTPAEAGGWCRGYGYAPYYYYRPYYGYSYAPYYRPYYGYSYAPYYRPYYGSYFYRPRAWGWGYGYRPWRGYGYRAWGWGGRGWGGWRRW